MGGDGTINQILESVLKINSNLVLGHIPAGTGNGLAASIIYQNNLDYSLKRDLLFKNNKNLI